MRIRPKIIVFITVLLGLVVHGLQAGSLGLYWDDSNQFLRGLYQAEDRPLHFIFADTSGALLIERPFSYVFWCFARASFLAGVPALHWLLVVLLVINATLLMEIARRMIDDHWFVFAVGALFLTNPLSPLQAIWPACVHYLGACLLTLVAIYGMFRAIEDTRSGRWLAIAVISYLASVLTHSEFLLLAPTFAAVFLIFRHLRRRDGRQIARMLRADRRAAFCFGLFVLAATIYALWRSLILPTYGSFDYPHDVMIRDPRLLLEKVLSATQVALLPWPNAGLQISHSPPMLWYVPVAIVLAAVVWREALLMFRNSTRAENSVYACSVWLDTALIGAGLILACVVTIAISPYRLDRITGVDSRVNFAATVGLAIFWPAALRFGTMILVHDRKLLMRHVLSALLAGFVFVGIFFHFSLKQTFVRSWNQVTSALTQLKQLAPALENDTLVVFVEDCWDPFGKGYELSDFLQVIYGNETLQGNVNREVRFVKDGVESTVYGYLVIAQVPYDRILFVGFDGEELRILSTTYGITSDGQLMTVRTNPDRIRLAPPKSAAAWRHVAP